MNRRDQVAANLATVRKRIATAATAAGRDPDEITLVVVTKYFPASDVEILADLGVTDVGENRHQEAVEKAADLRDLGLRWHFVGNLQSNKAAAVAGYVDVVHSVDRPKLLNGLGRGADAGGRALEVLLQVDLDPHSADSRGGAQPENLPELADRAATTEGLRLRGLMAVAPLDADPARAFEHLASLSAQLREQHPDATWISAGMSGDLEQAITAGATHVRVGGAVLGERPRVP